MSTGLSFILLSEFDSYFFTFFDSTYTAQQPAWFFLIFRSWWVFFYLKMLITINSKHTYNQPKQNKWEFYHFADGLGMQYPVQRVCYKLRSLSKYKLRSRPYMTLSLQHVWRLDRPTNFYTDNEILLHCYSFFFNSIFFRPSWSHYLLIVMTLFLLSLLVYKTAYAKF